MVINRVFVALNPPDIDMNPPERSLGGSPVLRHVYIITVWTISEVYKRWMCEVSSEQGEPNRTVMRSLTVLYQGRLVAAVC